METEVTSDLVEQALATFYHGPPEQHQAANSWLTSVQISPSAWTFCWDLLRREGQTEMQFFGACTLHVKLARFWKELPPEKYDEVKDRTLMEISRFLRGQAPKMIFSKLCSALAVFAIQTSPDIWPDTVRSLVAALENPKLELSASDSQLAILEVLTVLPEEFPAVHVEQFRRSLVRNELSAKGSPFVLQILESLFTTCQNAPSEEQRKYTNQCISAMKCLSSWIVLGLPMENMRPIFPHLFAAIRSEPLFESAADALVHVAGHPDMNKYPTVVNELISSILGLNDLLQQALQSQDADSALSLGRIVITLAETNTSHLLDCLLQDDSSPLSSPSSSSAPSSSPPGVCRNVLNFISMILACSGAPGFYGVDELVSELPFGFWYSFQDEIVSANEDKRATLMVKAQNIYMALIEVFLVKVRFPADSEFEEWSCEEKEQFRCYRQDISDTIVYAYNVLGESLLVAFVNALNSLVTSNGPWQNVEAVLFLFSATSEGVERRFSQNVEVLLRMLPMIPVMNERRLVSTVLHLVGGFAEWLSAHPQPIVSLAPLLLQALRQPTLLEPASFALKDLCRESKRHLVPVASDILGAAHDALQNPAVKNRDKVRLVATCGYIFSAMPPSTVMGHLDTLLTPHVNELVAIASSSTSGSSSAASAQGLAEPAEREIILCKLDMLGSLYTTISSSMGEDEEGEEEASEDEASYHLTHGGGGDSSSSSSHHYRNHPPPETHATTILAVQGQIQELLQKLLAKYLRDASIVEAVCELLHRCCKALMGEFGPLVDGTARLVGDMYNAAPQGSMLTLANQLTLVYHRETAHLTAIADMFRLVCVKSVSLFQTTTTTTTSDATTMTTTTPLIREMPDVAEAFFRYLSMVFRKCPSLVQYCVRSGGGAVVVGGGNNGSSSTAAAAANAVSASTSPPPMDLTPLIHCAIVGLKLPENPTVKAACGFFVEFVTQSSSTSGASSSSSSSSSGGVATCQRVLADQGLVILEATLAGIAGLAPRTLNDAMADVVFAFARNQVEMTRRWLEALLMERRGFPNPKVTRQQKEHFVKMVLKSNKRRVKEIVKEFSLICRGLVGTEYGMGQQRIDQFF